MGQNYSSVHVVSLARKYRENFSVISTGYLPRRSFLWGMVVRAKADTSHQMKRSNRGISCTSRTRTASVCVGFVKVVAQNLLFSKNVLYMGLRRSSRLFKALGRSKLIFSARVPNSDTAGRLMRFHFPDFDVMVLPKQGPEMTNSPVRSFLSSGTRASAPSSPTLRTTRTPRERRVNCRKRSTRLLARRAISGFSHWII